MTFQYQGGVKMEDVEDRRASTPPGLIWRGWKKDKEASRSVLWQSHLPAVMRTLFNTLQARVQGYIMLILTQQEQRVGLRRMTECWMFHSHCGCQRTPRVRVTLYPSNARVEEPKEVMWRKNT